MNSSKQIDISKSSLVGLKAELLKKQEEVKKLRELQQNNVKPDIIQKKKSVHQKSNDGVEKRRAKDTIAIEEDYDVLQKSREVLEAKSRLYDKLKNNVVDEETRSKYLINFDLKREIDKETPLETAQNEEKLSDNEEGDYSDSNSDPENDWVDFVDTLGRSRRCLRKDLPEMRAKDTKLAESLHPPSPPPDSTTTPTPELLSWDMQREVMRKKWEEQETLLLGKKDIHYQDVRFDEARPHGVGYFEFSTDEAERARQQEELLKLRKQTEEQQEAAQGLRARREQQMQARLAAARRRRRERLGLPPESPPHEMETPATSIENEDKERIEDESVIDLEESVKKIAPVRPWDIGKNGLAPVMSQEEWIEKKRQERPEEFAPPSSLTEVTSTEVNEDDKWKSNPNFFTSKKVKQLPPFSEKSKRKKSKRKKEKKSCEKEEEEDECFGPSVRDWEGISQQNDIKGSISSTVNNIPLPKEESRNEVPAPSSSGWKPTITDIDLLLSKSRAASLASCGEEESRDERLSQEPTMLSNTSLSSFVQRENKMKNECTVTSDINEDERVDDINYNSIHSKSNHEISSMSRTRESITESGISETVIKPIVNLLERDSDDEEDTTSKECELSNKWKSNKRKYAEIPPPPSISYYINADSKNKLNLPAKPQLADSISAGINYLKSQTEEKRKKRLKGMLDII